MRERHAFSCAAAATCSVRPGVRQERTGERRRERGSPREMPRTNGSSFYVSIAAGWSSQSLAILPVRESAVPVIATRAGALPEIPNTHTSRPRRAYSRESARIHTYRSYRIISLIGAGERCAVRGDAQCGASRLTRACVCARVCVWSCVLWRENYCAAAINVTLACVPRTWPVSGRTRGAEIVAVC
jgi:hypothetical protein